MRFFSNEAKDNVDEPETGTRGDTAATGATVPQQRAGSPWHHGPDDTAPVAVGSSTVGDTPATRPDDDPDRTDRLPSADDVTRPGSGGDTHPGTGATTGTTGTHDGPGRDTDGDGHDDKAARPVPAAGDHDRRRDDDPVVDAALDDRGTFDDPHATQPIRTGTDQARDTTDRDGDGVADTDEDRDTRVSGDRTPDDDPILTGHDGPDRTGTDRTGEPTTGDTHAGTATEPAATEPEPLVPAATTTSTISGAASFFPAADTQPLRDRWRDVQLRFVDDPKGATTEAAGLVDEAVDKLTTALREQRGSLAKGTDDTESLRVELRSYRDILDRLLGL